MVVYHHNKKFIIYIIILVIAISICLGVYIFKHFGSSPSSSFDTPQNRIRNAIRVDRNVRIATVNILSSYISRCYNILDKYVSVSAGSREYIRFTYYYPSIYELTISVSGNCIGTCDIALNLRDSSYRLVMLYGRVSYLKQNLSILYTLSQVTENIDVYTIELDNTYSIFTSKNVRITIRACLPNYVLDESAFKVVSIPLWVSHNVRYVSDPYGFEFVSDPLTTIAIKAGDCDDIAVLLTSMYRSVGLRSAIGLIDTNGDGLADHAAALVYIEPSYIQMFEKKLESFASIISGKYTGYSYFKRDDGIWLIIDPLMADDKNEPWKITRITYKLLEIIE